MMSKEEPIVSARVHADDGTAAKQTSAESKTAIPPTAVKVKQRKFANGDKYVGGWLNGLPEGEGKYEWCDGSSYEGGWKAGAKHGTGRYIWSSGASYQGDWQNGCMHGVGSFEAPDGSRYQGGWKDDLKHGLGRKTYANGDVYEGLWAHGKPDGPGRYIWVDFNEYDGEWRAGRMSGQGTFVWKTGERYDGEWKDGQEDGIGVFTFRDGSTYAGLWRAGKKHGVGIYRPAPSSSKPGIRRSECKFGKATLVTAGGSRSAFADASAAAAALPDEAAADFLEQRRPDSSSQMLVDAPSRSVDGQAASKQQEQPQQPAQQTQQQQPADAVLIKEYKEGKLVRQYPLAFNTLAQIYSVFNGPSAAGRPSSTAAAGSGSSTGSSRHLAVTPLGEMVYKGHSAYDLLQQLQLGIRCSEASKALGHIASSSSSSNKLDELVAGDFTAAPQQVFLRCGSRTTPVHAAEDFVWKDYAPAVFRHLRQQSGIAPSAYISSLCSDQSLQLISNPGGRSGALFFVTADEKYIVRTVTRSEARVLLRLLPQYVRHMQQQPGSLITRFYGLHRLQPLQHQGRKVHFVVMNNMFCSGLQIHKRFDLKGSTAGRSTPAHVVKTNSQIVLKDLDLQQCFKLQDGNSSKLSAQLTADAAFLCDSGIMDYSLLLGVHYKGQQQQQQQQQQQLLRQQGQGPLQNFMQHDMEAELSDAVTRLHIYLDHLQLDTRLAAALLELAEAGVLVGHVLAAHNPKLAVQQRSPAMLLLTRPLRHMSSKTSKPVTSDQDQQHQDGGMFLGQHMMAVAAPLGAAAKQALSASDAADDLKQQPHLEPVVLYFGIIDLLQCFTFSKKLESVAKRLMAPAASISAVAPRYYASRFRKFMAEVFV